jgi:hypothetical protein
MTAPVSDTSTTARQPKMIPNPMYCDKCDGRGYLVGDAEWEPYAVQCDACKDRRAINMRLADVIRGADRVVIYNDPESNDGPHRVTLSNEDRGRLVAALAPASAAVRAGTVPSERAQEMRNAIDMIEGAMMGLGDFVDLPELFDGARDEMEIAPRMTVGQMRRVCAALQECTRIINSDEYIIAAVGAPSKEQIARVIFEHAVGLRHWDNEFYAGDRAGCLDTAQAILALKRDHSSPDLGRAAPSRSERIAESTVYRIIRMGVTLSEPQAKIVRELLAEEFRECLYGSQYSHDEVC